MAGDGPFKKSFQTRAHRERSQPSARARLGLLEKHKDYQLRARDFHHKERCIKALRERAAFRNPDEFYFGMIKSTTKDGVHVKEREGSKALDTDVVKLLKSQDLAYVRQQQRVNRKKMERLQTLVAVKSKSRSHSVFMSDDDCKDLARLNTDASKASEIKKEVKVKPSKERRELVARKTRAVKLDIALAELQTQQHLMGKGRHRKIGVDKNGVKQFKWLLERKK